MPFIIICSELLQIAQASTRPRHLRTPWTDRGLPDDRHVLRRTPLGPRLRAGRQVVLVSGDPLHHTTSYLAAAVWFPTAAGPSDAVTRWGARDVASLVARLAAR